MACTDPIDVDAWCATQQTVVIDLSSGDESDVVEIVDSSNLAQLPKRPAPSPPEDSRPRTRPRPSSDGRSQVVDRSLYQSSRAVSSEEPQIYNVESIDITSAQLWNPQKFYVDEELVQDTGIPMLPPENRHMEDNVHGEDGRRHSSDPLWIRLQEPKKSSRSASSGLQEELGMNHWGCVGNFHAAGAITKIVQRGRTVAASSYAMGGDWHDSDDEDVQKSEVDPNNEMGTIMVYNGDRSQIIRNHRCVHRTIAEDRGNELITREKHYSVHDIAVVPGSQTAFVSSGRDRRIRVWDYEGSDDSPSTRPPELFTYKYGGITHDISFKPGGSTLAVACEDGKIYLHADILGGSEVVSALNVAPEVKSPEVGNKTGAICWGLGCTADRIFASTEPGGHGKKQIGHHMVFDATTCKVVCTFDANESGDAMALSPNGSSLALFTVGDHSTHMLRIYDVCRERTSKSTRVCAFHKPDHPRTVKASDEEKGPNRITRMRINKTICLRASKTSHLRTFQWTHQCTDEFDPCITQIECASYSPDGIYLALGRSDGFLDVYDTRMMARCLHAYEHKGPYKTPTGTACDAYGVTCIQWAQSRIGGRYGLVSGGDDGGVLLWDVAKAAEDASNGSKIASANCDVRYIHLGDTTQDEHALVVGDSGGTVYIYDHVSRRME